MRSLIIALAAAGPAAAAISVEPPPGWVDVTAEKKGVIAALKGPETSSFVLTRAGTLPLDNRAGLLSFLGDVLAALNRRGARLTQASGLLTATFDNGATFQYIKANREGKPRVALGIAEYGGEVMLGTLSSAVPDTILPSIISGLRGAAAAARRAGPAVTRDGQLTFALPPGLQPRELTESERKMGFVLAIKAADAELMVLKVVEPGDAGKSQPEIVRQTVLAAAGVDERTLSRVESFKTPAGTDFIYATARLRDGESSSEFLAGYMPWAYWGYSVLAKGADPADLAREAFGGLALGPSALPKLVASTPAIPLASGWKKWAGRPAALAALAALAAALAYWMLGGAARTPDSAR